MAARTGRRTGRSSGSPLPGLLQPGGVEQAVDRGRLADQLVVRATLHDPAAGRPRSPRRRPARWTAGARWRPWCGPGSPRPACAAAAPRSPGRPRWSPRPAPAGRGRRRRPGPARPVAAPRRSAPRRARRPACRSPAGRPVEPVGEAELGEGRREISLVGQRRDGRTGRCPPPSRRTGSRPAAPSPPGERSEQNRTRSSGTPDEQHRAGARVHQPGEQLGEGGLAAAGLPHHRDPAPRRDVRRSTSRSTGGPSGVGEPDVVEPHVERPGAAARRPASPGSATSGAQSSTSSTRRQPATAFCASLSTSVAICTGWMNSVTRNRKAISSPTLSAPPTPSRTPSTHHRGQRQAGGELAGGRS